MLGLSLAMFALVSPASARPCGVLAGLGAGVAIASRSVDVILAAGVLLALALRDRRTVAWIALGAAPPLLLLACERLLRVKSKSWSVYIVRCADGTLYIGATNDFKARLARHNAGTGARYTRSRLPVELAWKRRQKDKSAALSLEARLKRKSRAQKLQLITGKISLRTLLST